MRFRTLLIGWAAVVFGGSAAVGAYMLATQPQRGAEAKTVEIVVAAIAAPRGATLTADMLQLRPWPEGFVPDGALTSLEQAEGRAVSIPLVDGDPVIELKLAARGAGRGMAAMIPRGMRAVTLQTPNVSTAMAGFILPGNKVDVLLTLSNAGADAPNGGGSSVVLLQHVEVLAVDQHIEAPSENVVDSSGMQSVTLLVTPAEAARLDLGQSRGTLRLALRNPEDTEVTKVESAMLSALDSGYSGAPAPERSEAATAEAASPKAGAATEATEPAVAAEPTAPTATVLLPIRTLRGTSSSVLYLRRGLPRDAAVTAHSEQLGQGQSSR